MRIEQDQQGIALKILENKDVNLNLKDTNGYTVLMLAIASDQIKVAFKILDKDNVNINKIDKNGNTALHHVTGMGNYEIIMKLLEKDDIDLFIENKQGLSPFMLSLLESKDNDLIPLSFFKTMTEQNIINLTAPHPIRDNYKFKEQLEKINNLPEALYYELNFNLNGRITTWDRNLKNFLEDKPFDYNYIDIAYSDKLISIHIYFLLIPLFLTGYIFLLPQKHCKSLLYSALILYYKENKAKETYKLALDLLYINEITRKIITANNYCKEAIESNKIPDLIKQLTETQVDSTLTNINGSQNKQIKDLLLDRQAVIKQPNLIERLKKLEILSLPSIDNLSEINNKLLMKFLNINPNEITETANKLIAKFKDLKKNSSSSKIQR